MPENIHGYEVVREIIGSGNLYTNNTLQSANDDWFGQTAQFYICSTENISADRLIAFLAEKRKFHSNDNGFKVNETAICNDAKARTRNVPDTQQVVIIGQDSR